MKNNPWKGLVSYEEKDLDNYEFCGRTKAVSKYYSLITNSLVSTLYGRTGCGKTSMLQAGIFPLLRQESYFPVMSDEVKMRRHIKLEATKNKGK